MRRLTGNERVLLVLAVVAVLLVAVAASLIAGGGLPRTMGPSGGTGVAPTEITPSPPEGRDSVADEGAKGSAGAPSDAKTPTGDKLVIWNVSLGLLVKDVQRAATGLRVRAERLGGHVERLDLTTDQNVPVTPQGSQRPAEERAPVAGSITVRVPVERLASFLDQARKLGRVRSESRSSADVTQQHADLKARLDNLKAEEARLRTFFDSARKVSDMLAIERELARVRGEIESMTAQLRVLEDEAAMATVTVQLTQPEAVVRPRGTDWGVVAAVTEGIRRMVATFNGIIIVALGSIPVLALGALIILALWYFINRRRTRDAR